MAKKLTLANNPLFSGPALQARDQEVIPYKEIPIEAITRDPNQPRVNFDEERIAELAESIKMYGVISPILVKPAGHVGNFRLVAGERRLRASRMAGLKSIPAIITAADRSPEDTLAVQIIENLQRVDLSPLEKAHAMSTLKEAYNLSIRDVAEKLGVSKSAVQRSLDLLELPDDLLNALRQGESESKILLLAQIDDVNERERLLKGVANYSRDALKDIVTTKVGKAKKPVSATRKLLNAEDERIVDEIQRSIGMRVGLTRSNTKEDSGKITIEFYSDKDLQEIFRKLVID